jgi:hypothetical protein
MAETPRNSAYMEGTEANERLQKDYTDACAAYEAMTTLIVKRMEGDRERLAAKPTAAEAVAERKARQRLVAARRRVSQGGAQYLESLPIG